MSKQYFNMQQRVLILHSCIINNPKYEELKKILFNNKHINENNIDTIKMSDQTKDYIIYNMLEIFNLAKSEWLGLLHYDNDSKYCALCNQPNKTICYIKNSYTGETLNVGTTCIKHFDLKLDNGNDFNSHLKNIETNQIKMTNKALLYKTAPNIDKWIAELKDYMENSPYLLPYSIYNRLSISINYLVNSKESILKKKTKVVKLPNFKDLYEETKKHFKSSYNKWLNSTSDANMLVPFDLLKWMNSRKLEDEIQSIRKNDGNISENEIGKIFQDTFITSHLNNFLKLMNYLDELSLEKNYIKMHLKNYPINFLPIAIRSSIFMKQFGKHLFSQEPININFLIDNIECLEESISICDNLNALFNSRKFAASEFSSKIYVLFPLTSKYTAFYKNDLIRRIIKCTINQPYNNCQFAITDKLLNRINSKHSFTKSDEILLNRLNLSHSWIKEEVLS